MSEEYEKMKQRKDEILAKRNSKIITALSVFGDVATQFENYSDDVTVRVECTVGDLRMIDKVRNELAAKTLESVG